jgi:hydrogenase expression/formation protein HypE
MSDDEVDLALGEGGARTRRFIHQEIRSRFRSDALAPLEDGSRVLSGGSDLVVTADCYVVDPVVFPGGDVGKLAVAGTANDLLASGGAPWCMTLGLVLREGLAMDTVRLVLDSVSQEASAAGLEVVAGDTKVVPRATGIDVMVNACGIGRSVHPARTFPVDAARPGDVVAVSGTIGDHGLAVLSAREGLGFETAVKSDCVALTSLILPVIETQPGLRCLRDPTRGGLLGALADIAEASAVDIVIDPMSVPVAHAVRAGCELLGLDPLLLVNEGKMVLAVAESAASDVCAGLRRHPLGRDSTVVGMVRQARLGEGHVVIRDGATERVFARHEGAPIPRLC